MNERQKLFLEKIAEKWGANGNNIYPKPMTDSEALAILQEYFLDPHWYIADPVSHEQANVYIVCRLIEDYKVKGE